MMQPTLRLLSLVAVRTLADLSRKIYMISGALIYGLDEHPNALGFAPSLLQYSLHLNRNYFKAGLCLLRSFRYGNSDSSAIQQALGATAIDASHGIQQHLDG